MPRAPGPAPEDEAREAPCFLMGQPPARSNEAGLPCVPAGSFLQGIQEKLPLADGLPSAAVRLDAMGQAIQRVPPFNQSFASGMVS